MAATFESREHQYFNLYLARLHKEQAISPSEIRERVSWNLPILAQNKKCSVSLDLPLSNCEPTGACSEVCYAAQGRQAFPDAIVKSLAVNRLSLLDPDHAARKIVDEAAGRTIRLAGSGELLPEHAELVRRIEHYRGTWWGFTRREDTHRALPDLMFSIDATTPDSVLDYVAGDVSVHRRAYLRRPHDPESSISVAVTFPTHGSRTSYVNQTAQHETDCPSIRKAVSGCSLCRRCY